MVCPAWYVGSHGPPRRNVDLKATVGLANDGGVTLL